MTQGTYKLSHNKSTFECVRYEQGLTTGIS
jgi:hypothetical protein